MMGWDSWHEPIQYRYGKKYIDTKYAVEHDLKKRGYTIKGISQNGSTFYLALTHGDHTFGCVVLAHTDVRNYDNIYTKEMSEDMGPFYYDCPERILKMLSPTDDAESLQWREKCRQNNARKAEQKKRGHTLNSLPYGTVIQVHNDRIDMDKNEFRLMKMEPNHQFKTAWYKDLDACHTYMPKKLIGNNWTVVRLPEQEKTV